MTMETSYYGSQGRQEVSIEVDPYYNTCIPPPVTRRRSENYSNNHIDDVTISGDYNHNDTACGGDKPFYPSYELPLTSLISTLLQESDDVMLGTDTTSVDAATFTISSTFTDKTQMKSAIARLSLLNQRRFKVIKSCNTKYQVKCSDPTNVEPGAPPCPFHISMNVKRPSSESEIWCCTTCSSKHSCLPYDNKHTGNDNNDGGSRKSRKWMHQLTSTQLVGSVIEYVKDNTTMSLTTLREIVKSQTNMDISADATARLRQSCLDAIWGDEKSNMEKLRPWLHSLQEVDADTITSVETISVAYNDDLASSILKRVFMCPGPCRRISEHLVPFVSIDSTFCTSKLGGTLFTVVGLDGNLEPLLLAFGYAADPPSDWYVFGNDNWNWFLHNVKAALPFIDSISKKCIVMVRCGSGALGIAEDVFPHCAPSICATSIAATMKEHQCSNISLNVFREMLCVTNRAKFTMLQNQMREEIDSRAAELLDSIDSKYWATCNFPGNRWGVLSSRLIEGFNGDPTASYNYRMMPPLQTLHYLYNLVLDTISSRLDPYEACEFGSLVSSSASSSSGVLPFRAPAPIAEPYIGFDCREVYLCAQPLVPCPITELTKDGLQCPVVTRKPGRPSHKRYIDTNDDEGKSRKRIHSSSTTSSSNYMFSM